MAKKRIQRRTRAGRKVYYARRSNASAQRQIPREQFIGEAAARARYFSPANAEARQRRENHYQDAIIKTLGMNRGADNAPREEALDQLSLLVKLEEMDRHMVVHKGLKTVRILFYNKEETKYWFVERNLLTNDLYRSIDYGSREQAFIFHETDRVKFVR
jgi:hypothetical protein